MFGAIKLGKLFDIDVYVHGTFWLLPLIILFGGAAGGDLSAAFFELAVLGGVFGCVVLHEVGHALAARYYGIGTRDITLYPIGGVASLERMPARPLTEIVIALAGPAVNLFIAGGLLAGVVAGGLLLPQGVAFSAADPVDLFLGQMFWANVGLLMFNLLPAFPMDGGRVLRAVLSTAMGRVRATEAAVGVGTVVAAGFAAVGLGLVSLQLPWLSGPNVGLVLVAVVVFLLGRAELKAVQQDQARLRRRAMDDDEFERASASPNRFTGWTWDPRRKVWGQWQDGVLVREFVNS